MPKISDFGFSIEKSLTSGQVEELIKYSQTDPIVQKFTSDKTRFRNKKKLARWIKKHPNIFVLTNKKRELLGIAWVSDKKLSGRVKLDQTFAIRLYGDARGKGLAYDFARKVFSNFDSSKIWLSVHSENETAVRLYKKLGFREISREKERLIFTN